jgi:hypothetical protein
MSISLAHCITQKNQFFTRSPVLVHRHVHSTDLLSHCITQESHLEFLVNSAAQRRLIHHLHLCSHDDAPNTLGFHTFTLCSATGTSNSTDHLSHRIIIWSSSQLSEWRRSSLTYAYIRMPFRLKNAGATFQRAMDHAFKDFIGKFMVDYQDDLTVYSKSREIHLTHLKQIFEKCRIYGISLNPKKCLFVVTEGKLLGHVVSKEGVYIDPERIKAINDMNPPTSKKGVQSFFGKINFVRRFVLTMLPLLNPLTNY